MDVKWYGINALEFRTSDGTDFMVDMYVSRNRERLNIPEEVERYVTSRPSWVLMTHAHWDHLADMPQIIAKTDTILYASETACSIMRGMGVKEKNFRTIHYGDKLELPGGVTIDVIESRHMGVVDEAPGYSAPPPPETLDAASGWRCGEVFAFLIHADGKSFLNAGSANFLESNFNHLECDYFIGGISRWKEGFPQLLQKCVNYKTLIPTHHDEFTKPLSEFSLRNDLKRLSAEIPNLNALQLEPLVWTPLP